MKLKISNLGRQSALSRVRPPVAKRPTASIKIGKSGKIRFR